METNVIRKNLYFPDMQISLLWGDTIPCNNIVAFDKKGKEIWRINDILKFDKILEFTDIKKAEAAAKEEAEKAQKAAEAAAKEAEKAEKK